MPKTCQGCGKNQTIEINQKRYCANCGEPRPHAQSVRANGPSATAPPKADTLPHVLDLSSVAPPVPKASSPAQSVHGHREAPAIAAIAPLPTQRADKHIHRQARAKATPRHPKIGKFSLEQISAASSEESGAARVAKSPPKAMAPNHIYQINSLEETPRIPQPEKAINSKGPSLLEKLAVSIKDNLKFITRRRQVAPVLAVLAIVVALGGYITYLNVPTIAVRIAASRAGVEAQLPNYRPPGYALDGLVDYSQGQLTIRFNAENDRGYVNLSQRRTQWDPQTLLENYVTPKSANFIPFNQNGLTIYIYEGNNAAWINNGIFYTLEGENQLSQDQILKMAASL